MPTSDGNIRSALGAIVEAIRAAYGDNPERDQDKPDAGYDPAFVERTAPLLEFLWARYFRVRLLGVNNIPDDGAALLVGNHSGGIPYDGAMLLHGVRRETIDRLLANQHGSCPGTRRRWQYRLGAPCGEAQCCA